MLSVRYLTQKLRSQSLNEENNKLDLDRDSGTESDDELADAGCKMDDDVPQRRQRTRSESGKENSVGPVTRQRRSRESPIEFCLTDSALPSDSDHPWGDQHSSEEELECINGADSLLPLSASNTPALRFGPSAFDTKAGHRRGKTPLQGPEKRKWAQVNPRRVVTPGGGSELVRIKSRPRSALPSALDCSSASSDDEVQALVGFDDSPLPLEFRTSPPEGAHRPTRSPPPKFFLADDDDDDVSMASTEVSVTTEQPTLPASSPRKRHRHTHRSHIQRPCLDFEKMQQMKNRSVSTWRHDGELSLFCW